MSDTFFVELPWGLPANSPIVVNELELEIILLQQNIIDDLQNKLTRVNHSDIERLKALYDAMKAERDEIILVRDRARAETDVIRDDRARVMAAFDDIEKQNARLLEENAAQAQEIERLSTQLRHANQELAGVPKLVDNKVSAALANHQVNLDAVEEVNDLKEQLANSETRRAEAVAKNIDLNSKWQAAQAKEHELMMAIEPLAEQVALYDDIADVSKSKFEALLEHVSDLHGYLTLVCNESEEIKNENLYLSLLHGYDEYEPIFDCDGWKAFVFCKPTCLSVEESEEGRPDMRFGMVIVLNLNTGDGHLAYVDVKGELCIPYSVNRDICIPPQYTQQLADAIQSASIDEITEAMVKSIKRARGIVHNARLLDVDWCSAVGAVEVAKKLNAAIPQEDVTRVTENIERAQLLAPRTQAQLNRINKRFGTEFTLPPKAKAQKAPKPKKRRRK